MAEPQGNPAPESGQGNAAPASAAQGNSAAPSGPSPDDENNVLNQMFTKRTKKLREQLNGDFDQKVKEGISQALTPIVQQLGQLSESLGKLHAPSTSSTTAPDKKAQGETGQLEPEIEKHPAVQKLLGDVTQLTGQVTELTKKAQKAETERAQSEKRLRETVLRETLTKALQASGVHATSHAVGHLIDATRRVRYSDDKTDKDTIVFVDDEGEPIDLKTGLTNWVKSEDAQIYLPPRGTSGSGDRGGSRPPTDANKKYSVADELLSLVR